VFFFCKRRRPARRSHLKTDLELPLLSSEHSYQGNPLSSSAPAGQLPSASSTSSSTISADSNASDSSAGTEDLRSSLSAEAEYDEVTKIPTNSAAKKLVVLDWSTGAVSSVVNLPFSLMQQATLDFDEFHLLGTGASCVVFKGLVFGQAVAIKVRCSPLFLTVVSDRNVRFAL
jgi:hypothetical protein